MIVKTVVVGSESALKIRAVKSAFAKMLLDPEILPCAVSSGVPNQPFGKNIIRNGAKNRAREARAKHTVADFTIGIENGLVQEYDKWFDVPCIVIHSRDGYDSSVFGTSFPIPLWVVSKTLQQVELGHIIQEISGMSEKDPTSFFSENTITREEIIDQAVRAALTPLLYREKYRE